MYIIETLEHFSDHYQNGGRSSGAERLLNEFTREFALYLVIFDKSLT